MRSLCFCFHFLRQHVAGPLSSSSLHISEVILLLGALNSSASPISSLLSGAMPRRMSDIVEVVDTCDKTGSGHLFSKKP